MDTRQLQYFLRVKECGSFTAAAESLHVAQPSLSRQIRLLETELGHRLLIRHGRGVIATEAGKLLAEHSEIILRQVSLARQAFETHQHEEKLRAVAAPIMPYERENSKRIGLNFPSS